MSKITKILSVLLCLMMVVCQFVACDDASEPSETANPTQGGVNNENNPSGDNANTENNEVENTDPWASLSFYLQYDETYLIDSYNYFEKNPNAHVITNEYNGLPVTVIGSSSYAHESFPNDTLTIPQGITTIENKAFQSSTLASVTIPDSVTHIQENAFISCEKLTNITLPDTPINIHANAFDYSAYYNDTANWENGVLYIGKHLIKADPSLSGNYEIKEGTISIASYAFSESQNLTGIKIPESVESIGDFAFSMCEQLTNIEVLSSRISRVGENAFTSTAYFANEANWIDGMLYIGNVLINTGYQSTYHIKEGTITIADSAFVQSGCESVEFPNSLVNIGKAAFEGCIISVIDIPSSVRTIGERAFAECRDLCIVTIAEGVTTIGNGAFNGGELYALNIPQSVKSIGHKAFANQEDLSEITVSEGNEIYHASGNCLIETATKTLVAGCKNSSIPTDGSVTKIGYSAFLGCYTLPNISIPNIITHIAAAAFLGCDSFTNITIPENVVSIGPEAFSKCENLAEISLPNSLTTLSKGAFWGCYALTSITLPQNVTTLEESLFEECITLTSVIILGQITTIEEEVFQECAELTSITLPSSITKITYRVFDGCDKLEEIIFEGTTQQWEELNVRKNCFSRTVTIKCSNGTISTP